VRVAARTPRPITTRLLDIDVVEGPTPPEWDAAIQLPGFFADADRVLVALSDVRLFVTRDSVVVEAASRELRCAYDYLVYAWALKLVLQLNRRHSLHASVVTSPQGKTVAIAGQSMAGKSTTMAALLRRGWTFVCDDVAEVDVSGPSPQLVPHERPVHLSPRALEILGLDPEFGKDLPGREKQVVQLDSDLQPRRLDAIVHLRAAPDCDVVVADPVSPSTAVATVGGLSDAYGIGYLAPLRENFFSWSSSLARAVPVIAVTRPRTGDSIQTVADTVSSVLE
jgi:hypothetical protein